MLKQRLKFREKPAVLRLICLPECYYQLFSTCLCYDVRRCRPSFPIPHCILTLRRAIRCRAFQSLLHWPAPLRNPSPALFLQLRRFERQSSIHIRFCRLVFSYSRKQKCERNLISVAVRRDDNICFLSRAFAILNKK